jgi:hypothetical protein
VIATGSWPSISKAKHVKGKKVKLSRFKAWARLPRGSCARASWTGDAQLERVQTGPETGELAAQLRISISDVTLNPHPGRRGIDEAELDHETCRSSTIDLRLILTKVDGD